MTEVVIPSTQKGTHFDPAVVDAFLGVAAHFKSASDEAIADAP